MQRGQGKGRLQLVKEWLFQFLFTLDSNQFTNVYTRLLSILLQLTVLHYFYIHPHFSFLARRAIFQQYFLNTRHYFLHLFPFGSPVLALLALLLYPTVILLTVLIKKLGPNKIIVPVVQVAVFLYPLLWVKVLVSLVEALTAGQYLYLVIPLGVINLVFAGLLLTLLGRQLRLMELPLVLLLELGGNLYFTLGVLAVRMAIQGYFLHGGHRHSLGFYFQVALMGVLAASPFCDDQLLNNMGFLAVLLACLATGANNTRRALEGERSILHFADLLEEQDEEEAVFEVYRRVQHHHAVCDLSDCLCHGFYSVQKTKLTEWVYRFEEQRLRRGESFSDRLEYAERCWSHYEYRLSGLVRICEGRPRGVFEEYQVYRACSVYERNMRKQDKNYRYGEPYRNAQEELQAFHTQLAAILAEIRKFWSLITSFDGSTKFLREILLISRAIAALRGEYNRYAGKYDEELKEFKYGYELFLSIILNEDIPEEDEILVPDPCAFIITNGNTILNANNAFLALTAQTRENLLGSLYTYFIPEVYRDIHRTWAATFIEKVEEYEGKAIGKCLSVGSLEMKVVEMQHWVLPRFLDGLEIFTVIRPPDGKREREKRDTFVFLVEKETFYIKNVEAGFFDAVKFKVNPRNFKLLQEMALNSIFEHFNTNLAQNPARETTIFPHFLQEFTFTKTKRKPLKGKSKPSTRPSHLLSLATKSVTADHEQIFEFQLLPSTRNEDPYLKVRFTLKEERLQSVASSQESFSRVEPEQPVSNERPKKQQKFGFTVPYFLLMVLPLCHVFYWLGRSTFDAAVSDLQQRYQFSLSFDYTTLKVLSAFVGRDCTAELRGLWIEGFGGFSESFNAFRRVEDPLFMQYFDQQVTTDFHNQLFRQIEANIASATDSMQSYQALVMVGLLLGAGCYALDLLLALRYTLLIEGKVGALLLQFVIIESADVKEIMAMIESFESAILNAQEPHSIKPPIEIGEDSAFELMKGGGYSLNNSMVAAEPEQETPKEPSGSRKRRGDSVIERERVSLSLMKEELKEGQKSKFKRDSSAREEMLEQKSRNISLFKRQYRSCGFILSANKKLFLLIFTGFAVSMAVLFLAFLFLYAPFRALPLHLQTLHSLQQARLILLKSQTEILISSPHPLLPEATLSSTLLTLIGLSGQMGAMGGFGGGFNAFMSTDVCVGSGFNCSLLAGDNRLHEYGIKVISQYLENYFRQRNASALMKGSLQNQLILYTELLFSLLVDNFASSSQEYSVGLDGAELRMVVVGSACLLLGLIVGHVSLREFKARIENSRSLLQIIPKEIKKKQEKEIEELTLKEASTP